MAKGAGMEVKHVQNSSSGPLALFGPVVAWSLCILSLQVPTKASESKHASTCLPLRVLKCVPEIQHPAKFQELHELFF